MSSANVSFDSIPSSIRKPGKYFEFNTKLAVRTLPANDQKVLIIGQKTTAGTQPALTPVDVYSDEQARTLFGTGSLCHLMVRAAIRAYAYLQLTVLPISDDAAGVAATGTVTLTGPATGTGVVTLNIGAESVNVAVAVADTATSVATALAAAVNASTVLPVTATSNAGVVTLTARNKGLAGNSIVVSASSTAAGVTSTVVAMASGATDPDITAALAKVFAAGHTIVVCPYATQAALTTLRTHLDAVSGPLEQRGAVGAYAHTGTLATATTLAGQVNSGRVTGALLPGTASLPGEVAAAYAAVIASEEDPARPLNTLALTPVGVPAMTSRLSRTEQESALHNGAAPLEVGPGEVVQIVRAITTYTVDPQGVVDIALLDLTTIRTLDYVRRAVRERIALRFPREKLSDKTPPKVRSEIIDVLYKLEDLEIVEAVADNLPGIIVERDGQDPNRLNAKIPVDVVNGLHVFAGRIDLLL